MSLPILVALVTVGIALAVLSVHLTGGSKRSSIADADHAARLLLADFPNERPGPALLTVDGQSAHGFAGRTNWHRAIFWRRLFHAHCDRGRRCFRQCRTLR